MHLSPAQRLPNVGFERLHCGILIARGLVCDDENLFALLAA
jgi:hypothetical protein